MVQAESEKAVCESCGVDVRENTTYCYNCGSHLAAHTDKLSEDGVVGLQTVIAPADTDQKTKAALDDLAERLRLGEDEDNKLAQAAAERRRARVGQRKSREFKWDADEGPSPALLLLVAMLISLVVGVVVLFSVVWR